MCCVRHTFLPFFTQEKFQFKTTLNQHCVAESLAVSQTSPYPLTLSTPTTTTHTTVLMSVVIVLSLKCAGHLKQPSFTLLKWARFFHQRQTSSSPCYVVLYNSFVMKEMGLQDTISHKQASKKWENLKKKYKVNHVISG